MIPYRQVDAEKRGEREIVLRRGFDAPPALVFDAFTRPELIRRWMLGPGGWMFTVCDVDLRVGGRYRYEWRQESGSGELKMGGVFREITPGIRLVSTEIFDENWNGGEGLVTVDFVAHGVGTVITQTVLYATAEGRDMMLQQGMLDGLETGFGRLDAVFGAGTEDSN